MRSKEGSLMGIDITRPLCGIQRDINHPSSRFGIFFHAPAVRENSMKKIGNRKELLCDYASFPDSQPNVTYCAANRS